MPKDFSLVICDGPPARTPGGRYGLLPVMKSHLRPGCVILLDDVSRLEEREIIARWAEESGAKYSFEGAEKPFGILTLPSEQVKVWTESEPAAQPQEIQTTLRQ